MKHLFPLGILLLTLAISSSCTIIEGYATDGAYGPTSFSYEKHLRDTLRNSSDVFSFAYADTMAIWPDTLHFFNQGNMYENTTMWEAIEDKTESQGVLIIKDDKIIYEKCIGEMTTSSIAAVFSVSKSITSLLCGIAVEEGYISSVDDPVTKYWPELGKKNDSWNKVTIRHLLDMQSGIAFDDTYSLRLKDLKTLNAMAKLNYGGNIPKQIMGLKFRNEPGAEHYYESMTTEILGVVIQKATGIPYTEYVGDKIWIPLGMESEGYVTYDSKKSHTAHAFGGVSMTMKDLAKIGRLYLNKGVWEGKRIVSESWIEQSSEYSDANEGYHFCWYNTSSVGAEKPEYPGFYALGVRGQVLYVNPYNNMILIRFGLRDDTYAHIPYLFEQLSNTSFACE